MRFTRTKSDQRLTNTSAEAGSVALKAADVYVARVLYAHCIASAAKAGDVDRQRVLTLAAGEDVLLHTTSLFIQDVHGKSIRLCIAEGDHQLVGRLQFVAAMTIVRDRRVGLQFIGKGADSREGPPGPRRIGQVFASCPLLGKVEAMAMVSAGDTDLRLSFIVSLGVWFRAQSDGVDVWASPTQGYRSAEAREIRLGKQCGELGEGVDRTDRHATCTESSPPRPGTLTLLNECRTS